MFHKVFKPASYMRFMAEATKEAEREIKKEEKKIEKSLKKFFSKRENVWMAVAIVLLVALIIAVAWPRGISSSAAGQKIIDFAKSRGVDATLVSINDKGSLYEVTINIEGQPLPVYITKDGRYFTQMAIELSPSNSTSSSVKGNAVSDTPEEVPKTDKPVVQAFVFSYCPYGLQFEKALIPVYNLLKNKADINIVFIGAMHGEYEKTESLRQLCIQKNYGKDKLFSYLNKFNTNSTIGSCSGSDTCLAPLLKGLMSSLGIDKTKIDSCMAKDAEALYSADGQTSSSLGVSGSPTFFINGVEVSVARNPDAIKTAICNAFTDSSKISECSQTLSTASSSAGFGADAGSSSGATC